MSTNAWRRPRTSSTSGVLFIALAGEGRRSAARRSGGGGRRGRPRGRSTYMGRWLGTWFRLVDRSVRSMRAHRSRARARRPDRSRPTPLRAPPQSGFAWPSGSRTHLNHGGVLAVGSRTAAGKSLEYLVPGHSLEPSQRRARHRLNPGQLSTCRSNWWASISPAPRRPSRTYLPRPDAGEGTRELRVPAEDGQVHKMPCAPSRRRDRCRGPVVARLVRTRRQTARSPPNRLPLVPRTNTWTPSAAEHNKCLRTRCPEYERCFFSGKLRQQGRPRGRAARWSKTITCC